MLKYARKLLNKDNNANDNAGKNKELDIPFTSLEKNLAWFKEQLFNSTDLNVRNFNNPDYPGMKGAILYLNGMVDINIVNKIILTSILKDISLLGLNDSEYNNLRTHLQNLVPVGEVKVADTLSAALTYLISGYTLLILENQKKIYSFDTRGPKERQVEEAQVEQVIRGPRVGFVESLEVNVSLIRRRSKDPNIVFEMFQIGNVTKTNIVLVYHQQKVIKPVLDELIRRLKTVKVNRIEGSGILEQSIEDNTNSIFPQFQYTERPDKVSAGVEEGKIGILVNGTPSVLLIPAPLASFFQSPEDYLEKWQYGSLLRMTRFLAAFLSSSLPALYIAVISYHPEFLPTNLAFSIGQTRLAVPFPAFVEALLMELFLELLQEASIRLPKMMGQTVGIVGGLVIGQAAVQAGIISPIMVIIISTTAISSFVIPSFSFNIATRLLRVPYIFAATFLGYYGLMLAWILTLTHLCHLKTVGSNYMEGLTPLNRSIWDSLIKAPMKILNKDKS